jgi:hypothetical protein
MLINVDSSFVSLHRVDVGSTAADFTPDDGGSIYLYKVGNSGYIHTVQSVT